MSHEITVRDDGTAEAAYALVPAWHGLGTVVDHAMTSEEALRLAHLDWQVEQWPIAAKGPGPGWPTLEVPGQVANVRTDLREVLGVVSPQYEVVQNSEAFAFVDALVMDGIVKYEAAGSLKGGRIVWLLARMPQEFEVVAGDKLRQYILFSTSHDGSRAVRCLPTSVRVVCWNTYTMAMADEAMGLSIRHMGNLEAKLVEARLTVTQVGQLFSTYYKQAARLAASPVDAARMEVYLDTLFPGQPDRSNKYRIATQAAVRETYLGQVLEGARGTAWDAINAVTQVVDHRSIYRPRHDATAAENRMASTMFGGNAALKRRAMNLALNVFVTM